MAGFNFEKNLLHQELAVKSVTEIFEGVDITKSKGVNKEFINPIFEIKDNFRYRENIKKVQSRNSIDLTQIQAKDIEQNILDIMMETGTGKTYTYAKTIFELNKLYGIFKFIIVVPTLPIKAGTIDFLNSEASREHFKEQYGKKIQLHIVDSKKSNNKGKKAYMPASINNFVNAGSFEKNKIQVLIINAGMINSETLKQSFDKNILDKYAIPFEAISATKSFMIIDEPHKFGNSNKTWENIQKMNPQVMIRYGATFPEKEIKQKNILGKIEKIKLKDYHNLLYTLSAVDSFNQNLVKGVIGHITEFDEGKNIMLKFIYSDGVEATFHLIDNNTKKIFKITKKESLEKAHLAMADLFIEKLNTGTVVLSNGLELKKGDKLNPYSYSETLQETIIEKAIKHHFEQEKEYLTRSVKIKPLTLFFIDNIDEYRNQDGYIRKTIEKYIKAEAEHLLNTEKDIFYRSYLEKTLQDISKTHGGYFSKDNTEKDELIEKEVNEILHDKQAVLSLDNPRRFIFSKWTLREGWDNPNIFQICKLRSSGSDISKLQEVGRGLRLPVNQYGNRVKDEQFYLNYFVDFTENDFVDKLVNEINKKSGAISREIIYTKLDEGMIKNIIEKYHITEEKLLEDLDNKGIIKRNNNFKENGYEYIKSAYPLIFDGIDSNKIRKSTDSRKKVAIRAEKYTQLKDLWEKINQKVILEYKIANESKFEQIFTDFLRNSFFMLEGAREKTKKVSIENNQAMVREEQAIYGNDNIKISTIKYSEFLEQLSQLLNINIKTIHKAFISTDLHLKINNYLNQLNLRAFKTKFDNYLMYNAINQCGVEYQKISSKVHPTKFTNQDGEPKQEINSSDIGVFPADDRVAENYLFDKSFYDSELEKDNIKTNLSEITVFTKIPKNSIKIPVAGGKSYSPDFAYVLNMKDGNKKLYFIVETKNTDEQSLRDEEKQKIRYAEKFFGDDVKIKFKKQFSNQKIADLVSEVWGGGEIYG